MQKEPLGCRGRGGIPLGGKLLGLWQQEAEGRPAQTGVPGSMQETPGGLASTPAPLISTVPAHAQGHIECSTLNCDALGMAIYCTKLLNEMSVVAA